MGAMQKNSKEYANFKYIDIYSIDIPNTNPDIEVNASTDYISCGFIKDGLTWISPYLGLNITAHKFIDSSYKVASSSSAVWDARSNYSTHLFYPITQPLSNYTIQSGTARPNNSIYPALIDFSALAFSQTCAYINLLAKKNDVSFFKLLNSDVVSVSSSFLARQIVNQDQYYFDAESLQIYDKETNKPYHNTFDIEWFRPMSIVELVQKFHDGNYLKLFGQSYTFNPDNKNEYSLIKPDSYKDKSNLYWDFPTSYQRDISREWSKWKYFGSQLKTYIYNINDDKKAQYIQSLLDDGETYISCESIENADQDTVIKYLLNTYLPDSCIVNDDNTFIVNGMQYKIDYANEAILNSKNQVIDYIILPNGDYLTFSSSVDQYIKNNQNIFFEQSDISQIIQYLKNNDITSIINKYGLKTSYSLVDGQNLYFNKIATIASMKFYNKFGLVPIFKKDDLSGGSQLEMASYFSSITNGYPLNFFSDGRTSFVSSNDPTISITGNMSAEDSSLVFFDPLTIVSNINIDTDKCEQYAILLHNDYIENNLIDKIEQFNITPICIFNGVTSAYNALVKFENNVYKRTYTDNETNDSYKSDDGRYYTYTLSNTTYTAENISVRDYVKFPLQSTSITLDRRLKKAISAIKNNQLTGYLIKYKDVNDNIKVKLHKEDSLSFSKNISDKKDIFIDIIPLVPFYTNLDLVQPIIYKDMPSFFNGFDIADLFYFNNVYVGAATALPVNKFFYYIYDKKVTRYYERSHMIHLTKWEKLLNGDYKDEEYNVKTFPRLSRKFSDPNYKYYMGSSLTNPANDSDALSDVGKIEGTYSSYYNESENRHGYYGNHTSVRFSFIIFFNSKIRKTKLLNKMACIYLEYFFKSYNGQIGNELSVLLYPPDRIHFKEKQAMLSFTKYNLAEDKAEDLPSTYFSILQYNAGTITFYNKVDKVLYVLNVNKLYPLWKSVFFSNKEFSTSYNQYDDDSMTITSKDIIPLSYEDILIDVSDDDIPTTMYTKNNLYYSLLVESVYYNTSTAIIYQTKNGDTKTRSLNIWNNPSYYCCFYTPKNSTEIPYSTNPENSIAPRNVIQYIRNKLMLKSIDELKICYKSIFSEDVSIDEVDDSFSPFNYNNIFSDGILSEPNVDFSKVTDETITIKIPHITMQTSKANSNTMTGYWRDPQKIFNNLQEGESKYFAESVLVDPHYLYVQATPDEESNSNIVSKYFTNTFNDYYKMIYCSDYTLNIALCQSYAMYNQYISNSYSINIETTKEIVINKIIRKLFETDLPTTKIITVDEFQSYFINYDKDKSLLFRIFTDAEIYDIGFTNYLVSDMLSKYNDDISSSLKTIFSALSNPFYKFDLENNDIQITNFWLPLPVYVYSHSPYYCKRLLTTLFATNECYMVRTIPIIDSRILSSNRKYQKYLKTAYIVIAVIFFFAALGSGSLMFIALASSFVSMASNAATLEAQLYASDHPYQKVLKRQQKVFKIVVVFLQIVQILGSIGNMTSGINSLVANFSWGGLIGLVSDVISFTSSALSSMLNVSFQSAINQNNIFYNLNVAEYNKKIDQFNQFVEKHEYDMDINYNTTNNYLPTKLDTIVYDVYDTYYNEQDYSIEAMYSSLNDYYELYEDGAYKYEQDI